jgi:hypothetical protein
MSRHITGLQSMHVLVLLLYCHWDLLKLSKARPSWRTSPAAPVAKQPAASNQQQQQQQCNPPASHHACCIRLLVGCTRFSRATGRQEGGRLALVILTPPPHHHQRSSKCPPSCPSLMALCSPFGLASQTPYLSEPCCACALQDLPGTSFSNIGLYKDPQGSDHMQVHLTVMALRAPMSDVSFTYIWHNAIAPLLLFPFSHNKASVPDHYSPKLDP